MDYILVLQWPGATELDYNALIEMEGVLEAGLGEVHGFVDGHDFGSGEMNIFVHTDKPFDAFEIAHAVLGAEARWPGVRAAFRPIEGDHYEVIWPDSLQEFSVK